MLELLQYSTYTAGRAVPGPLDVSVRSRCRGWRYYQHHLLQTGCCPTSMTGHEEACYTPNVLRG